MSRAGSSYERRILEVAVAGLDEEPLLLLQGPRTVGKTYLLRELASRRGGEVIDLDDPPTRDAVRADASTFLSGSAPIFVDEYQHEPAVLAAIKAELNVDLRPGRFVLASSTARRTHRPALDFGRITEVAQRDGARRTGPSVGITGASVAALTFATMPGRTAAHRCTRGSAAKLPAT